MLPSVMDYLSEDAKATIRIIKPAMGHELQSLLDGQLQKMSVRLLTMPVNTATPIHMHFNKEKIYVALDWLFATLVIIVDGHAVEQQLNDGEPVCVEAEYPHFIKHTQGKLAAQILVISSSQDSADIKWENRADELIQNKHLERLQS